MGTGTHYRLLDPQFRAWPPGGAWPRHDRVPQGRLARSSPRHSRLISSRYRASTESRTSLNTLRTLCVSVAQVKCEKRRRAREPFLPPSWGSAQLAYTRAYMSKMKRLAASASRRGPAERAWGRMGFFL